MSSFEEENDGTFRQRLWGAAVFIAILVIVLPLLLDGAGSESQFKRVEKLRQEPPNIIDQDGRASVQSIPESKTLSSASNPAEVSRIRIGEDDAPNYQETSELVRESLRRNREAAPLTAWVVQAGSFNDQENALAVRNLLRRSGFASFVRDREAIDEPFRVLVGPMINKQSAENAQRNIETLLGRNALVKTYP